MIDSSVTDEFFIDDVCMVDEDWELEPCEVVPETTGYPVRQLISLDTNIGEVVMSDSSPSECDEKIEFSVTCAEDCGNSSCDSFD